MLPWSDTNTSSGGGCAKTADELCGIFAPGCRLKVADEVRAREAPGYAALEPTPEVKPTDSKKQNQGAVRRKHRAYKCRVKCFSFDIALCFRFMAMPW